MSIKLISLPTALVVASLCVTNATQASLITFNDLVHGEIVNTQYAPSITVFANNFNRPHDLAIAFDSDLTGTSDSDLEYGSGWSLGNIGNERLGEMLIISENEIDSNGDGIIDDPDDEGQRPAGTITFDFGFDISEFGFDLVDVEGPSEFGADNGYFATFFGGGSEVRVGFGEFIDSGSSFYDSSVEFGDNSANRIYPITASDLGIVSFDRVVVNFGGSAAIDNIVYAVPVPEPGTLLIMSAGLVLSWRTKKVLA